VRGLFDTEPNTEELSIFYDMPNAMIQQIIERIHRYAVQHRVPWKGVR